MQRIEDDTAIVLDGKTALENLMLLVRSLQRRGVLEMVAVDRDSMMAVNEDMASIRRALDLAHERLKEARQADT